LFRSISFFKQIYCLTNSSKYCLRCVTYCCKICKSF
jgi:hypothetical protein